MVMVYQKEGEKPADEKIKVTFTTTGNFFIPQAISSYSWATIIHSC